MSSGSSLTDVFIQDPKNLKRICLGRGPDSVIEQSDTVSFSLSLVSTGKSDSDKSGVQDNAGEQEMTGRTPAVLITRELFYRSCELSNNYNLDKNEAVDLFKATLQTVEKGWVTEGQNTKVTIGDTLSVKDSDYVSTNSAETVNTPDSSASDSSASDSSASDSSASGSSASDSSASGSSASDSSASDSSASDSSASSN